MTRNYGLVVLAGAFVIVLGIAFAVVKVGGLGLIDEMVAGMVKVEEAQAFDATWQTLLAALSIGIVVEGLLRIQWTERWLGVSDVPKPGRRDAIREQLKGQQPTDRRLHRANQALSAVGVIGIFAAIAMSLLYDDLGALRLTFVAKAGAGLAIAGSSAAFIALVLRNRDSTAPAIEVDRRRLRRERWPGAGK